VLYARSSPRQGFCGPWNGDEAFLISSSSVCSSRIEDRLARTSCDGYEVVGLVTGLPLENELLPLRRQRTWSNAGPLTSLASGLSLSLGARPPLVSLMRAMLDHTAVIEKERDGDHEELLRTMLILLVDLGLRYAGTVLAHH